MSLSKDLLFLIRQFCNEEKLHKTAHMLERETGFFFDMDYFDDLVMNAEWNEAENYLSGFTSVGSNQHSMKTYFEIRKQKFYEALDKHDVSGALDVLLKDLKVFASSNEELYRELTLLLTLDDFREHPSLSSSYGDVISARREMVDAVKLIIKANPLFCDKLDIPQVENSRLRRLINQSLNWQHLQCLNPQIEPQIKTLFMDHKCTVESNEKESLTNATMLEGTSQTNWIAPLDKMVLLKNPAVEKHNLNFLILNDFPKTVARCMDISSSPTSMDFHPAKDFLILVGNIMGDVELYDISSNMKLFSNAFKIWKQEAISEVFLKSLETDPLNSVSRVLWSPDGSICGIAFSRNIVQLYSCSHVDTNDIKKHLEIEAHSGGVNDLAFTSRNDKLLVITCGEDKLIQVWDSKTGLKQHTFEGHGAPVYSLCPNVNEDIHILLSTATNGEIKAWLFESTEPVAEYDAPGCSHMKMAYSDDGKRLFSCGTNADGNSHILEWDQTEGYIIRTYDSLCSPTVGVVQLSTTQNRFLVAGDDRAIKVWDMDNAQLVTALDADGDLIETPYVCFNKKGTILAAFAERNKIKILANDHAGGSLQSSTALQEASGSAEVDDMEETAKPQDHMKINSEINSQKWSKIVQVSHCHSFRLLSEIKTDKLCRLTYTNSGNGILALAADGIHLLWKSSGKGDFAPKLWQPRNGLLMINHLSDDKFKVASSCFALSKNDMYLVSASGKGVSLFNTTTFKELKSCLSGPPTASCIAFYPPDNNIVAIGMDDSTILVYNMRLGEDRSRLVGHVKMVTGLAFSNKLKVLLSSGIDNQIIVWDTTTWKKMRNVSLQTPMSLQTPTGWFQSETVSETNIQFHQDQKQFLAIHETQLGIYDATNLKRVNQWMIGEFCARLTNATFSSDNRLVYAVMRGGIVVLLTASDLCPRLEIDPSVYLPTTVSSGVYPIIVAANPKKPNQFALGLSDGGVVVLEPNEDEETWIISPPDDVDDDDEEEFAFSSTITTN